MVLVFILIFINNFVCTFIFLELVVLQLGMLTLEFRLQLNLNKLFLLRLFVLQIQLQLLKNICTFKLKLNKQTAVLWMVYIQTAVLGMVYLQTAVLGMVAIQTADYWRNLSQTAMLNTDRTLGKQPRWLLTEP